MKDSECNKCTVTAASQATFLRKCCGKSSRPGLHHVSIHCIGLKFAWESYQILQSCLVIHSLQCLLRSSESLSWQQQRTGKGCGLKAGIPLQEQGTWMDLTCSPLEILRVHWVHIMLGHAALTLQDFSKRCHTNTSHSYSTLGRMGVRVYSFYLDVHS